MYGPQNYARVYKENSILTASPGQLVLLLFDGALRAMGVARAAMDRPKLDHRKFEIINKELIKAQAILLELKGTLNHSVGGEYAGNMERLYDYYIRRLREANMRKIPEPVAEVERLLGEIREAWSQMLRTQEAAETRQVLQRSA